MSNYRGMMQTQCSQRILRASQKLQWPRLNFQLRRWLTSDGATLQAGDRVLLRYRGEPLVLTRPLRSEDVTPTRFGDVHHDSIIGKQLRDVVTTSKRWELRVQLPTLNEYVRLTPRLVTPIYSEDANVIVSLLDFNPSFQPDSANPPMEILEAGTGHGALTLHLARAIHAANPQLSVLRNPCGLAKSNENLSDVESPGTTDDPIGTTANTEGLDESISSGNFVHRRQAIIHSLDNLPKHSNHARKIVQDFRRGLYSNDVDFHVGDVSEWIDKELALRASSSTDSADRAFLSHILLDLPGSHNYAAKVVSGLRVDGNLVVFAPSITQIVNWVDEIRKKKLPLLLDQVLELGRGISGGRQWDVRAVKPKALLRASSTKAVNLTNPLQSQIQESRDDQDEVTAEAPQARVDEDFGWEMICKPKIGEQVIGGGFIGLWKKEKRTH